MCVKISFGISSSSTREKLHLKALHTARPTATRGDGCAVVSNEARHCGLSATGTENAASVPDRTGVLERDSAAPQPTPPCEGRDGSVMTARGKCWASKVVPTRAGGLINCCHCQVLSQSVMARCVGSRCGADAGALAPEKARDRRGCVEEAGSSASNDVGRRAGGWHGSLGEDLP